MRIYLDHNAGAPLKPVARDAMIRFLSEHAQGNPSSVHFSGQRARRLLEQARADVAALVEGPPSRIVFTSGGTESNNLAISGALHASDQRRRFLTSSIEHSSILAPMAQLERQGFEVIRIGVDHGGRILRNRLLELIDPNTALVSLGLVNAEVGTIQDLEGLADAARNNGAIFHVDAAQAVGRIPVAVERIGCDLMTISSHKIGGPGGVGALYVGARCQLAPQLLGGPQEAGVRAGTQNLAGAIGFAAAARETRQVLEVERERLSTLARMLFRRLERDVPALQLNGPREQRVESTLNLSFPDVLGESLLIALDLEGIEVSMGSACAAGAVEPSHVLISMGRSADEARSSLRISLGWSTTEQEIDRAAEVIPRVWRRVAAAEPGPAGAPS